MVRPLLLTCIAVSLLGGLCRAQTLPYPNFEGDGELTTRLLLIAKDSTDVHIGMGSPSYYEVAAAVDVAQAADLSSSWADKYAVRQAQARLGTLPDRELSTRDGLTGWLKRNFYKQPGYALDLRGEGYRLLLSPIIDFDLGTQTSNDNGLIVRNARGVFLRGMIGERVSFQTTITENQDRLASWEQEWSEAYGNRVPGVGFIKRYEFPLFDDARGVDYIQATGELGFKLSKYFSVTFGHGNPRLGRGYRSMVLDDFVDPFLYLQIDTKVGRIHYRNLFFELQDGIQSSTRVSRKYVAAHTLSVKLSPSWEVSLSEQTVMARDGGGFDLQYLNPVILYRAVEQDNGSPDNALFALQTNVKLGKRGLVYGQILLDEFNSGELFGGNGWWANKYAWQLGAESFGTFGLDGLDVAVEANLVRPFTYGHRFGKIDYTHYGQPLAHPLGSSLVEGTVRIGYAMAPGWRLDAQATAASQDDVSLPPTPHIGANPIYNNNERGHLLEGQDPDYGYSVAGEAEVRRAYGRVQLGYSPFPGAQASVRYEYYQRSPGIDNLSGQHGVTLGLSLNARRRASVF